MCVGLRSKKCSADGIDGVGGVARRKFCAANKCANIGANPTDIDLVEPSETSGLASSFKEVPQDLYDEKEKAYYFSC